MKLKHLLALSICFITFLAQGQQLNMELFEGLKLRNIGPAGMSGRVTAIDAVYDNPDIIYVGTASGGLWKTTGGGVSWKPIFDKEKVASIGALAIVQSNPDIIWVGTGEGNPRNSQSSGAGVYRSLDAGRTWQLMGLEGTRNIHRILVDPNNPNVVYVGAQGSAWGESTERGVFKSTDGGKSWKKILYVNTKTGIGDMVMDPTNPNKIIAGMWEFRRWPWFFKSGGAGSGLYITYDGGENWKKITDKEGLPKGDLGRIGLTISPSSPEVIYALVESKKTALYKSTDGGAKWSKIQDKAVGDRPFYYGDISVDPQNENRLYNIFSQVHISEDGGKTFSPMLNWNPTRVHGDHHFWWIHPGDPSLIIDGNDGGLAISRDRGKSWRFIENLPVGQFYHINVDNELPYNVYGGMQDNGSWQGPSNSLREGGIRNGYWNEIAFGDGFDVVPDRGNPRYAYGMWQGGNLLYIDLETGHSQYIKPIHPDGEFLRFNWNAAISDDPFDVNTIYYGSQYVHRSRNKGQSWEIISPDLTTNDAEKQKSRESGGLSYDASGAENYTTILAIAPSPVEKGVIWATTDDGNVHVSRDDGETWTKVNTRIKGLKAGSWLPQIKASHHEAGEAFLVANDYRRDDWTPWLFRTKDYGKSWERIIDQNDVWGYVLSFAQDPVEPNLLFAGTEFGLYVSVDGGAVWTKWKGNYPTVSTYDMAIQPRDHDLVIGTFGRSVWILDDIRPLREIAQKGQQVLDEVVHLYPIPDAYNFVRYEAAGTRFMADAIYKGDDKADGAMITYSLKATSKQDTTVKSDTVSIRVFNHSGDLIRSMITTGKKGMNRFTWDLNRKGYRSPNAPKPKKQVQDLPGRTVLPGTYTIQVAFAGDTVSSPVNVKADPRFQMNQQDLALIASQQDELLELMKRATTAVDNLNDAKQTIGAITGRMRASKVSDEEVSKSSKDLMKRIKELKEMIRSKEGIQGFISDPFIVSARIGSAFIYQGDYNRPNESQKLAIQTAKNELSKVLDEVNGFFEEDWATFKNRVDNLNLSLFSEYEAIKVD